MLTRKFLIPLCWLALGALLSAGVSLLVSRLASDADRHTHYGTGRDPRGGDFHHWLHENLRISPEQEEDLRPLEDAFAEKEEALKRSIRRDAKELAHRLRSGRTEGEDWRPLLQRIHATQGELQERTLAHFIEMSRHLEPEDAERLLRWTHDSIHHEH